MLAGIFLFLPRRQVDFGKSEVRGDEQPRHCRIGWRIVRGQSHRCPPAICGGFRRGL